MRRRAISVSAGTCKATLRTKYGSGGTSRSVTAWLSQTVYAAMATPVSQPQTTPGQGLPWVARGDQEISSTPATTSCDPDAADHAGSLAEQPLRRPRTSAAGPSREPAGRPG